MPPLTGLTAPKKPGEADEDELPARVGLEEEVKLPRCPHGPNDTDTEFDIVCDFEDSWEGVPASREGEEVEVVETLGEELEDIEADGQALSEGNPGENEAPFRGLAVTLWVPLSLGDKLLPGDAVRVLENDPDSVMDGETLLV